MNYIRTYNQLFILYKLKKPQFSLLGSSILNIKLNLFVIPCIKRIYHRLLNVMFHPIFNQPL